MVNDRLDDAPLRIGLGARKLGGRILEVRPPELLRRFFLDHLVEKRQNLLIRRFQIRDPLLVGLPPLLIHALQIGNHQSVFRTKERIQRRLCDIRLPQNPVNANHPDPLSGE